MVATMIATEVANEGANIFDFSFLLEDPIGLTLVLIVATTL